MWFDRAMSNHKFIIIKIWLFVFIFNTFWVLFKEERSSDKCIIIFPSKRKHGKGFSKQKEKKNWEQTSKVTKKNIFIYTFITFAIVIPRMSKSRIWNRIHLFSMNLYKAIYHPITQRWDFILRCTAYLKFTKNMFLQKVVWTNFSIKIAQIGQTLPKKLRLLVFV